MNTPTARLRRLAGALSAVTLVAFGSPWGASPNLQAQDQVLFVSATDESGAPVTDLTDEELVVQWDGKDSEIRNFESIDWPVKVTVYVDNSNEDVLDDIRAGLKALVQALPDGVEVGLASLSDEITWVTEHTADKATLGVAIDAIEEKDDDTYFLDAIIAEAGTIAADTRREYFPVVVMVTTDGDDTSDGEQAAFAAALGQLQTNGATLHTRLLLTEEGNGAQSMQALVGSAGGQQMQGSSETVPGSPGFTAALTTLGQDIARKHGLVSQQYRVAYRPPSDVSAQPAISVGSSREGLNVMPTLDGNVP
ncbi:MAG TPA: hypothetical protein EYQ83_10355 [Acidobacteria bacterium]|nr:hypothetical protein [Acidobacteriota bacterium]